MDPVQKTAERRGEVAGLILWCLIGHGLPSSFYSRHRQRDTQPNHR